MIGTSDHAFDWETSQWKGVIEHERVQADFVRALASWTEAGYDLFDRMTFTEAYSTCAFETRESSIGDYHSSLMEECWERKNGKVQTFSEAIQERVVTHPVEPSEDFVALGLILESFHFEGTSELDIISAHSKQSLFHVRKVLFNAAVFFIDIHELAGVVSHMQWYNSRIFNDIIFNEVECAILTSFIECPHPDVMRLRCIMSSDLLPREELFECSTSQWLSLFARKPHTLQYTAGAATREEDGARRVMHSIYQVSPYYGKGSTCLEQRLNSGIQIGSQWTMVGYFALEFFPADFLFPLCEQSLIRPKQHWMFCDNESYKTEFQQLHGDDRVNNSLQPYIESWSVKACNYVVRNKHFELEGSLSNLCWIGIENQTLKRVGYVTETGDVMWIVAQGGDPFAIFDLNKGLHIATNEQNWFAETLPAFNDKYVIYSTKDQPVHCTTIDRVTPRIQNGLLELLYCLTRIFYPDIVTCFFEALGIQSIFSSKIPRAKTAFFVSMPDPQQYGGVVAPQLVSYKPFSFARKEMKCIGMADASWTLLAPREPSIYSRETDGFMPNWSVIVPPKCNLPLDEEEHARRERLKE